MSPTADVADLLGDIPLSEIRALLDRQAISACILRWFRGLDRHDADIVESVFWPDAQISYGNTFTGQCDEFVPWGIQYHTDRFVLHQHHLTTQTIELDGDTAHAESYVIFFNRSADRKQLVGGARYIDRLERRNGEWRVLVREFISEMRFIVDSLIGEGGMGTEMGRWDREDISYRRPLPRRP